MEFSLETFLPYQLNRAAELTSLEFQRVYKGEYGMLRTEWRVLFHLGQYGPITAGEICNRAGLHKTKVSRAVAALEEKRFLTRTQIENDRRHERLALTSSGKAAFERLTGKAKAYQEEIRSQFSDEEFALLVKCLGILGNASRGQE